MPVHNEEDSITNVVRDVYDKLCKNSKIQFEIILSEDGSSDGTKETIIRLSSEIPLKAILSRNRKGYAGGIKNGLRLVSAPFVLIFDSDGQNSPEDFWKLKQKLEEEGARRGVIISGNRVVRSDALHRRIISKTFQKLNSIVFDLVSLKDITCPFKLMDSQLAIDVASECRLMNESFWTEFIIRAYNKNITIKEVSVKHRDRMAGSTVVYKKSKLPRIIFNQLIAVIKLKKDLTKENLFLSFLKTTAIKRLFSFVIVGASGAGVILLLLWIGTSLLKINYIISAAVAIELSILWSFALNDKFTFRDKIRISNKFHRLLKYQTSALSGEAINIFLLYILTSVVGVYYLHSEIIAILIVFIYNFTLSNIWVWRTHSDLNRS
jgi:dolichol-phosphate mannosyltransferase